MPTLLAFQMLSFRFLSAYPAIRRPEARHLKKERTHLAIQTQYKKEGAPLSPTEERQRWSRIFW
jgi:hypothetical protein